MGLHEPACPPGPASHLEVDCTSRYTGSIKAEPRGSPHKGQSSEKSSQDGLPSYYDFHDKDEGEYWPGESPTSSKQYIRASASAGSLRSVVRVSTRRVKAEAHSKATAEGGSPRHGSCTDPDWSPSSGLEDGSSGTPPARTCGSLANVFDRVASEVATEAQQKAQNALKDALLKKEKAAKLVATAKRLAVEATRCSKRRRVVQKPAERLHSPDHILLGARVAVYWPDDKQFYNGKVVDVKDEGFLHKVEYDDQVTEWLPLGSERFTLLTPRTTSAGCTTSFLDEVESLSAEGFSACRQGPAKSNLGAQTPRGEAALGWVVAVQCRFNGHACQGQLVAYEADSDRHHLLYADGEDEWLCLAKERVQWIRRLDHPIAPGLPAGVSRPVGEEAVGWRVAVHWQADKAFHPAIVESYNAATGQHCLAYSRGEHEHLHLGRQSLKWCPRPDTSKHSQGATSRGTLASLGGSAAALAGEGGWGSTFKVSRPRSSRMGRRLTPWNGGSSSSPDLTARNSVNESVAAMLERVDADEAALMSEDLCPSPYFHLHPQPQAKLETHSSAPQLGGGDSGGVRVLQPITPAQTDKSLRRPFPAGGVPTEPLRKASPAPDLFTMDKPFDAFGPAPAMRMHCAHKSEPDLHRHLGCRTVHPEDAPPHLSSGLLADMERATSMPTAPSPAPLLDCVPALPPMFQEPGMMEGDCCQPFPMPVLAPGLLDLGGDDLMEDLLQVDAISHGQDWMTDL